MQNMLISLLLVVAVASCCRADDGADQHQKFSVIASALEADDQLETLVSFVDSLGPRKRYYNYKDLVAALTGSKWNGQHEQLDKEKVGAVLKQCRSIARPLHKQADKRRWVKCPMDELTEKWLTISGICKILVEEGFGLSRDIVYDWLEFVNHKAPLYGFPTYLEVIPDEVGLAQLDQSLNESDEKLADLVKKFIKYRMISTDRAFAFQEVLEEVQKACKDVVRVFEPALRMLQAGDELDKSHKRSYNHMLSAVKAVRVCQRVPSLELEPKPTQKVIEPEPEPEPIQKLIDHVDANSDKPSFIQKIKKKVSCGQKNF